MKRELRDQFKNAYISILQESQFQTCRTIIMCPIYIHAYIHIYKYSLLQSLSKHANMKRELRDQFKNAYISKLQESNYVSHIHSYIHTYKYSPVQSLSKHA